MSSLIRFGVSAEEELMENFDRLSADKGYSNRSEALRDLMRDALALARLEKHPDTADVLGSLTLVYDHHVRAVGTDGRDTARATRAGRFGATRPHKS